MAADLLQGDFERVLARIDEEVKAFEPSLVFVDSFRSVVQTARAMDSGVTGLQHFVQHLGMQMTSWLATTFLIGEYLAPESESSPVFTVADGILWMSQLIHRDALVRKIQVVKMRGQAQRLGVHTFRINSDGVEIFPRMVVNPMEDAVPASEHLPRLPLGNATLDEMMGGGLPTGYSLLVVGPSGSGKTVLASAFLAEGVQHGETGVIAAFEKSSRQLRDQRLSKLVADGHIGVINTRTLDLSLDEILHELVAMIVRMDAKRVVIDSISGLEMALAPMFREDFKESLYRLIATLSAMGVTVLMTVELEDCNNALSFNSHGYAFLGGCDCHATVCGNGRRTEARVVRDKSAR
ncbi:RAD55 family ATPase [Pseudoduganella sp. UC29_106]|uniref:RAD55 family ATPase n=1 Tax=Pseudoduganella sp. UC29_106 TaxID=3374553 RepID=UPI003757B00D